MIWRGDWGYFVKAMTVTLLGGNAWVNFGEAWMEEVLGGLFGGFGEGVYGVEGAGEELEAGGFSDGFGALQGDFHLLGGFDGVDDFEDYVAGGGVAGGGGEDGLVGRPGPRRGPGARRGIGRRSVMRPGREGRRRVGGGRGNDLGGEGDGQDDVAFVVVEHFLDVVGGASRRRRGCRSR